MVWARAVLGEAFSILLSHLGSGLEKRVAIIVEKSGDSQVDSAAASQDGFIKVCNMGMDIHLYMEYCNRKTNCFTFYREFETHRCYGLFGIMAEVFCDENPLYISRGFPGDASEYVLKEFRDWGTDAHHTSWLNAEEFGYCLDFAKERYPDAAEDWLKDYEFILKNLRESDNDGEPARIVFWFDN